MRDNFIEQTKRVIQERAGNRCSNLDCRVLTSGPNAHPEKSTKTGVAAHITAASPGGPRYQSHLTSEQRKSADNGIWLCQNCAHFIDTDHLNYPVALLSKWKAQAEKDADDETKGRKSSTHQTLPTPPEHDEHVEGWYCPFCGTVVQLGKSICLGCQAEVVPGLTRHERQETAKTGAIIGAGLAFLLLFVLPNWLKSSYDWRIEPFWGIGIYGLVVTAILVIASAAIAMHFSEQRKLQEPPRFFRPSIQ